jgi:hypothetical protein
VHQALEDARLRLERADEHLDSLNRERRSFLDQAAGGVVSRFESDSLQHVFYVRGQPPRAWSAVLSDFANQLRATLDNLVSALARERGGDDSRSSFPIATTPDEWKKAKSRGYLAGLSASDRAAIKAVQPFVRRNPDPASDPLATLAWLSNRDKHRSFHGCYVRTESMFPLPEQIPVLPTVEGNAALLNFWLGSAWNPDGPNTDLAGVTVSGPDAEVSMQGDFRIDVAVTDGDKIVEFKELFVMRAEAGRVVATMAPHFP